MRGWLINPAANERAIDLTVLSMRGLRRSLQSDERQSRLSGMLLYNAPAKLRASQIKCERSELPKTARQLQRSLDCPQDSLDLPELGEELLRCIVEVVRNLRRGDGIVQRVTEEPKKVLVWFWNMLPVALPAVSVHEK
jgi:hypothetical protein